MKILMLISDNSLLCGIARHVVAIASELVGRAQCEVAVCTVYPHGELNDELERHGVKTFVLDCASGHSPMGIFRFAKVMREYKPDIVHVHVLAMSERIALSRCFGQVKVVTTIHGINDSLPKHIPLRSRVSGLVEGYLCRKHPINIRGICYISNGVRRARGGMTGVGDIVRQTVYNPIRFDDRNCDKRTNCVREIIGVSSDTPVIGTACRFAAVKSPETFTEVMCRVLERQPSVHAVLIGDGEFAIKNAMKRVESSHDVGGRLHWLGYRKDGPALVSELSCFIMTSKMEGLPTALLEAMAAKVPVAFLKGGGGLEDLVSYNESEGPIAAIGNGVDDLVSKIVELLGDASRAAINSRNAYEVCRRHFGVDSVCRQLMDVYREVLKND